MTCFVVGDLQLPMSAGHCMTMVTRQTSPQTEDKTYHCINALTFAC